MSLSDYEQCAPWCLNGPGGPNLGCICGADERNRQSAQNRPTPTPTQNTDSRQGET